MTGRHPVAWELGIVPGWLRALVGGLLWTVGTLLVLPRPFDLAWGQALLLLAPLVLLPLGFDLAVREEVAGWPARWCRLAKRLQLPTALLLGVAYLCPQGVLAGGLAVPWLATTGLMALVGLWRIRRRGLKPLAVLCSDAGLVYVVVGGAWAVSDRLGFQPLDFDPAIVLLTAIHFHYAGFTLPVVTGLAMRSATGVGTPLAGIGVVAGVPLVAVGITATQLGAGPLMECLAAWWMAAGGMWTAWLHLRLALQPAWPRSVRSLWAMAAVSLLASMVLAGLYGARFVAPLAWLDIPWMRALHGTANALGFALAGMLGWWLALGARSVERPIAEPPQKP